MAIKSYKDLFDSIDAGRTSLFTFRKAPNQTTGQGIWFDLSLSPGNPVPNYYAAAPLNWTQLKLSTDGGLYHGQAVTPGVKYLKKLTLSSSIVTTTLPLSVMVLDYLGYYPFCDMDGEIALGATTLSRSTTGEGVQIMVVEVAGQVGGSRFFCTYTNQDGTAGRVTPTHICNTQVVNGTLVNSGPTLAAGYPSGPFMTLQAGDTGVRSVESITFLTSDVGLVTVVLVKPVATVALDAIASAIYSPTECDFAQMNAGVMPVIEDDAYLNLICLPTGTLSGGQIYGTIETVWSA